MARIIEPLRPMQPLGVPPEADAVTRMNFRTLEDQEKSRVAYETLTLRQQRALAAASPSTSNQTTLTASTSSDQAGGTQLIVGFNQASVCANAGDSFKLPTAVAGHVVRLRNDGAEACDVFPLDGDSAQINGAAVDAAISVAAAATAEFNATSTTQWWSDT